MKQVTALTATALIVLVACSPATDGTRDWGRHTDGELSTSIAEPKSVLVSGDDPTEISVEISQQFFESSRGAVVTADEHQLEAASLGIAYSVPVLLEGEGLELELERLGVEWVITVGTPFEAEDGVEVIRTTSPSGGESSGAGEQADGEFGRNEDAAAVDDIDPDPRITVVEPHGDGIEGLLALDEGEVFIAPEENDIEREGDVEKLEGAVVLTDGSSLASVGTARAAGADVILSPADPRGSSEAIQAASSADIVLGIFYQELEDFEWQLATASTGVELPGGTQLVFGNKRYIALYGSPVTPSLGLLGEQDVPATVARAEEMAEPYRQLTEDTIVPAQEIIVTVAAGAPGPDGNYSNEGPIEWFIPLIEAAGEEGQSVILDFQPGRSDFLTQVQMYEELLAYPHVGIALDPEWRLGPDEQPLTRIGHVEIDEVNEVVNYLADYVRENNLPQKMIILHQFQLQMIRDRDQLDLSRSEVALLIHADGQGSQGAKADTWRTLHHDAPEGVAWGWKNFIDEDLPMLTPEETYAVEPLPEFVSYQ